MRVKIHCLLVALLEQGTCEEEGSHGGSDDEANEEKHCLGQQEQIHSHGIGQEGDFSSEGLLPWSSSPAGLCNVAQKTAKREHQRQRRRRTRSDSHGSSRGSNRGESPCNRDEKSNVHGADNRVARETAAEDDELAAALLESADMAVVEQAADEAFHRDVDESQALSQRDADLSLERDARQMELAIGFAGKHGREVLQTVPNGEDQLIFLVVRANLFVIRTMCYDRQLWALEFAARSGCRYAFDSRLGKSLGLSSFNSRLCGCHVTACVSRTPLRVVSGYRARAVVPPTLY